MEIEMASILAKEIEDRQTGGKATADDDADIVKDAHNIIYHHNIVKLIVKRKQYYPKGGADGEEIDDIKLVFIGDLPIAIRRILYKLEINGGQMDELENNEKKLLNNTIPFFATKVGDMNGYMLKFIYMQINDDIIIDKFQIMCLDILISLGMTKDVDNGESTCYAYPRELPYSYILNTISYMFFSILDIYTAAAYTTGMSVSTSGYTLTGSQIAHALYKYLNIGKENQTAADVGLISDYVYSRDDLLNIPQITRQLVQITKPLNQFRYMNIGDTYYLYYKYGTLYDDIERLGPNILQTTQFTRFSKIKTSSNYDTIDFHKYTTNNTIYMDLGTDMKYWIKNTKDNLPAYRQLYDNLYAFRLPIDNPINMNHNRLYMSFTQNNGVINQAGVKALEKYGHNQRDYIARSVGIKVNSLAYGNVIYDSYHPNQDYDINLLHFFREIKTNTYLPIVKYVSHGETQLYNIYRPFLRNLDNNTRSLFLTGHDYDRHLENNIFRVYDDINIRMLLRGDYIIFKWKIIANSVLNVYLFRNAYTICEYQFSKLTPGHDVANFNTLLLKTIQRVREYFKLRSLVVPNPNKIFHPTSSHMEICKTLSMNNEYSMSIDNKLLYIWYLHNISKTDITREEFNKLDIATTTVYPELIRQGLIKYIINNIKLIPTLWITDTVNEDIKFVYKNTYKFFSTDNARNFTEYMIQQHNKKLTPKDKSKILHRVQTIFNYTSEEAEEVYNSIDLDNIKVTEHLLYQVNGHLRLNKKYNTITIRINDSNNYRNAHTIITIISNIIKDFMFNTTFNNYNPIALPSSIHHDINSRDDLPTLDSILNSTLLDISHDTIPTKPNTYINDINKQIGNDIDPGILSNLEDYIDDDGLLDMQDIDLSGLDENEQMLALDAVLADPGINLGHTNPNINNMAGTNGAAEQGIGYGTTDKSSILKVKDIQFKHGDINAYTPTGRKKTGIRDKKYWFDLYTRFDPKLFDPYVKGGPTGYKYGRSDCPSSTYRTPAIVTKEQLDDIDPESITGYMLYRGNYYICPRIWDAKANLPISAKKFIANGMRSPYTGGKALLEAPTESGKKTITDEYNVIIRKPTTDKYWSQPELQPDWPELLKHTEKDAYPGLTFSNKHPNKDCVPCCFLNMPEDYDPTKKDILHRFDRPFNYIKCHYDIEHHKVPPGEYVEQKQAHIGAKGVIDVYCSNDDYISGATSRLKNCRLGLLPDGLNALLNNGQNLFLRPTGSMILEHANLFLRRGIIENPVTNILDTFANIMEKPTESLINVIVNKLTPVDFIMMYNGELIDMFCNSENLPMVLDNDETGIGSVKKFAKFIEIYPAIIEYFSADKDEVIEYITQQRWNKYNSAQTRVDTIIRSTQYSKNTPTQHIGYSGRASLEPELLSLVMLLYKIMTAFYNYISYLASPKEIKHAHYVIELFTRPRNWPGFYKDGLNVVIFDSAIDSLKCLRSFNYKSNKLVILIQETTSYYVPVFHVVTKHGKMSSSGIIKLTTAVNLDSLNLGILSRKHPTQLKYIHTIKDRLTPLVKLLYIQSELCNYNISYFANRLQRKFSIPDSDKDINTLFSIINSQYMDIGAMAQVAFLHISINLNPNAHVNQNHDESTKQSTKKINAPPSSTQHLILPVYPRHLIKGLPVFNYYRMHEDIAQYSITIYLLLSALYNLPIDTTSTTHNAQNASNNTSNNTGSNGSSNDSSASNNDSAATGISGMGGIPMSREWETLYSLDYHVEKIIIENVMPITNLDISDSKTQSSGIVMITGVQFYNGLTMSLLPTKYNKKQFEDIQEYIYKTHDIKVNIVSKITVNLLKDTTILALSSHKNQSKKSSKSKDSADLADLDGVLKSEKVLRSILIREEFKQDIINGMNLLIHIIKSSLSSYIYRNREATSSSSKNDIKDLISYLLDSQKYIQDDKIYKLLDTVLQNNIVHPDKSITMVDYITSIYGLTDAQNSTRLYTTGNHNKTRKIAYRTCDKPHKEKHKQKQTSHRTLKNNKNNILYGSGHRTTNTHSSTMPYKKKIIDICVTTASTSVIRVPHHMYMWILYNIGRDLVYDKSQMDLIITGKYIVSMGNSPLIRVMNDVYSVSSKTGGTGKSDTIILSVDELQQYIVNNNISKFRRNYNIKTRLPNNINPTAATGIHKSYLDGMGRNITVTDEDVKRLSELMVGQIEEHILSGLSRVFTDISSIISSKQNHKAIKTTVFNSEGIYNPMAHSNNCVFPYRANTGGLSYSCMPAKDVMHNDKIRSQGLHRNELICPTETTKSKKISKWGYCPEDPEISRDRMSKRNTRAVDAYKYMSKNLPKRIGYCEFPFIYYDNTRTNPIVNPGARSSPFIRIAFDCVNDKDKAGVPDSGSWCYSKPDDAVEQSTGTKIDPDLLIGTKRKNAIYHGKWSMDTIYKHNPSTGVPTITQRAISTIHEKMGLKRAECNIKNDEGLRKRIERKLGLENVPHIKLAEYVPDKCLLSQSKRGYTKKQLYIFGRDELSINYNLMLNIDKRIISKGELCEMFNRKIRELKKGEKIGNVVSSIDKRRIYGKDPEKCLMGPSKGGYSLADLRDMAITHFGLTEAKALQMNKTNLCDYIIPQLDTDTSTFSDDDLSENDIKKPMSIANMSRTKAAALEGLMMEPGDLYPKGKNINSCSNSQGRGGLSKKQAVAVAARLNINTEGKSKEDICSMIRDTVIEFQNRGYNPTSKKIPANKDDIKAAILQNIHTDSNNSLSESEYESESKSADISRSSFDDYNDAVKKMDTTIANINF